MRERNEAGEAKAGGVRKFVRMLLVAGTCHILAPQSAEAREPVGYLLPASPDQAAFAPWLIAKQLGYYADAGYDVNFTAGLGSIEVARLVGSGKVAVGGAIGDTPIIVRELGVSVKTIAVLGGGSLTAVVAGANRGIRSFQDLRGKHLLVLSLTDLTYHVLLGVLSTAGLSRHNVSIDTARPQSIVRRVLAGTADACACIPDWEVEIFDAQPDAVAIPTEPAFPSMAQAIITSDPVIAAKPDMLRAIVAGTLRGMQFIVSDPRKAADVFVQAAPKHRGEEALLTRIFQTYVERTYRGQAVPGQVDAGRLEALQRFYLEQKFIRHAVPVGELYTNDFLPAVPR